MLFLFCFVYFGLNCYTGTKTSLSNFMQGHPGTGKTTLKVCFSIACLFIVLYDLLQIVIGLCYMW